MQITLETDYAVRCMVYLRDHDKAVSVLGSVSEGTRIPQAFLSKILQKLVKSGLVRSAKGKSGGFALARPPSNISVYAIMQAVCGEEVLRVVCNRGGKPCELRPSCKIHPVWSELSSAVRATLEARKLSRL